MFFSAKPLEGVLEDDDSSSGSSGGQTGGDNETNTGDSGIDFGSSGVFSWIAKGLEAIIQAITSVLDFLNPLSNNFILKNLINLITNLLDYINPFSDSFILNDVLDFLGNIFSSIGSMLDYINPFSDKFLLKSVLEFLSSLISYINPFSENFIGYKLIDLFSTLFQELFVPDEANINSLLNVVNEKFTFIDSIKIAIDSLENILTNGISGIPKLEIEINSNYYTGKVTLFDFNWYKQYKSYADLLFTGFVYIFFLWRLYIKLPSIISGVSGSISTTSRGGHD